MLPFRFYPERREDGAGALSFRLIFYLSSKLTARRNRLNLDLCDPLP